MFHIESAHAALNFYILLVLSLCLVYTGLHDEGLNELHQVARLTTMITTVWSSSKMARINIGVRMTLVCGKK